MPKIRVLPDILASQVAAGEVVERPASVVKELVENSVDAGAREVRVDIDKGGVALIRVSDDGCGMSREDALLSLERHATSKLRDAGGLAAIRTLGFRGEAVPSIASVSRFRMLSREADAVAGTEILVDGGKVRDVREAGCAPGTTIEARGLFFNLPARRKFLKAESTESAHVEHQLRLHALAAPQVRFRLRKDERDVFDLPAVAKSLDRVRQLLANDAARELIPLPLTLGNDVSVEGYVLPARHARKGRRHQFVFLNGRPIEDPVISRALAEGFRGEVADGLHPAAWLWIDLEPNLVDVNVHPAKREVRFHKPYDLRDAILRAVTDGLRPPAPKKETIVPPPKSAPFVPPVPPPPPAPVMPRPLASGFRAPQPMLDSWVAPEPAAPAKPAVAELAEKSGPRFRPVGMLHRRYGILESDDGLVLFDPKAARERILYETLLRQHDEGVPAQRLLVPVLLDLDPRDHDLVLRERQALSEAGIEIGDFGGNTVQVQTLPASLDLDDPRPFLSEWLDETLHESAPGARFAFSRLARILAKRASWLVVPRFEEIPSLLEELFRCELPYCAADGRPTLSEFGMREIDRRFQPGKG
ncbi:MAG: DNA mismatch repair endonuclease MutL [Akkermansiaceae bacterium]|nr:DNA mismatch repair endonuclease MutL [Akkermansiaceae bacterium]